MYNSSEPIPLKPDNNLSGKESCRTEDNWGQIQTSGHPSQPLCTFTLQSAILVWALIESQINYMWLDTVSAISL